MKKYFLSFILYGILLAQTSPEEKARQLNEENRHQVCCRHLENYKKSSFQTRHDILVTLASHVDNGLDMDTIPEITARDHHAYSIFGLATVGALESCDPTLFALFMQKKADPRKVVCINRSNTGEVMGITALQLILSMFRNSSGLRKKTARDLYNAVQEWQESNHISDEQMEAAMKLQVITGGETHAQKTGS